MDTGIIFRRVDLPGQPEVPARLEHLDPTARCTRLSRSGASVQMVEHLLAALRAMEVDNALIEVKGPEIPMGDGSSQEFVRLIESVGISTLKVPRKVLRIEQPAFWSDGKAHLVALPAEESRFSYTLHYPQSPVLGSQYYSCILTPTLFKSDLSMCRTFSLFEEIEPMLKLGLLKGGGLENGVVIRGDKVLNPEGLRRPNEPVCHKLLDLIGDLTLLGAPIVGHILAVCSGHSANASFAKEIAKQQSLAAFMENC